MTTEALPYVTVLGVLFGSTLVVSRFSVGQYQPSTYIAIRLMLAGLAHVGVYALSKKWRWPADRSLWRHAAVLGVFATAIPMNAIVASLQYQSSGITSALLTTGPAVTVLMAHFFLRDEPLTRRKSLGVLLALAGTMVLTLRGESGLPDVTRANPIGYGLVLLAVLSASGSTIYARVFMRHLNPFDVASVRMWVAALVVTPLSYLFVGFDLSRVNGQGYGAVFYASLVGTFTGMMLAFYIIQRFGATASSLTSYVIPVVATIAGALFLGETITAGIIASMLLIVLGIALINQRPRRIQQGAGSPPV